MSDELTPTRFRFRLLLFVFVLLVFVLEPLLLLIFMLLVILGRLVMFWPCELSEFGLDDCIKFAFDMIGLSWLFWWLYGGGGVIRICVSYTTKKNNDHTKVLKQILRSFFIFFWIKMHVICEQVECAKWQKKCKQNINV